MRDKQREETRRRLYHAALEVFCRDGVDECRIEDIAMKAEVSRAAFYFHFPTKDDVILELLRESDEPVGEALTQLGPNASLDDILETTVKAMANTWAQGDRSKLLLDVFAVALRRTTVIDDRDAVIVRATLGERFKEAAARGELSPMIPPEALADFFLLNCLAAMASWCVKPFMPLEDMLRGVAQLFMYGARPPPQLPAPAPAKNKKG